VRAYANARWLTPESKVPAQPPRAFYKSPTEVHFEEVKLIRGNGIQIPNPYHGYAFGTAVLGCYSESFGSPGVFWLIMDEAKVTPTFTLAKNEQFRGVFVVNTTPQTAPHAQVEDITLTVTGETESDFELAISLPVVQATMTATVNRKLSPGQSVKGLRPNNALITSGAVTSATVPVQHQHSLFWQLVRPKSEERGYLGEPSQTKLYLTLHGDAIVGIYRASRDHLGVFYVQRLFRDAFDGFKTSQ